MVPPDHLVRQIDGILDLDWVHKELAPYYSHTGRPSIDPVLMIRMLIVGYVFAIRSERQLCSEVQVNLAYRWFCKLGIEDDIPDHSVFSRARHERFRESDALRKVFEGVVAKCIAAGLVCGEGFSIDASLIKADTVYGAVRLLKWLVDRQITPHIPVWDKSARSDGTFSRADFVFDRSRNIYICPNGKLLHTTGTVIDGSTLRYRASKLDCDLCALKMQCCPHTPARQIPRDVHEDARDVARALAKTEAFEQSRRERKKVEMRFAHMKRIFKLDRLRLRGLSGARDEVLLTATAQNLRRLAKFLCRAPPAPITCAA